MKVNFAKNAPAPAPAAAPLTGTPATPATQNESPATLAVPASPVDPTPVAVEQAPKAVETVTATTPTPTPVADVVVESTTTVAPSPAVTGPTVTQNDNTAVAIQQPAGAVEKAPSYFDDESIDPSDLQLPRFNIVQKVGELSNNFKPGSLLLNGQLVLQDGGQGTTPSKPINILVVGFQPTIFVERVEGGLKGNMFRTEQEVEKANGTLDWNEAQATGKTIYQRSCTALLLIEQIEGIDESSFPNPIGGKNYALALYTMKGTSYTNGAKHFKSARKIGHLRKNGYRGGFWTLQSQLKKFGENFAYIPVVKPTGQSTPEFRKELLELLGF